MMCSLCGCIILSKDVPAIREWSPLYVMITVIVVMSEKLDTTITKGEASGFSVLSSLCSLPAHLFCAMSQTMQRSHEIVTAVFMS